MKRKLISIAVGAACAVSSVATLAADAPTFYGRFDMALETVDTESTGADAWAVTSYASRFGFKGSAELSDSLTAIYKYETGTNPDTQASATFSSRNAYLGLKNSDMGTVILGRHDTPLKSSQGKVDLFDNHAADINNTVGGDVRANDLVAYISPKIADSITVKVALAQGEQATDHDGNGVLTNDDGLADGTSLSVDYQADGLYLALANDASISGRDLTRITARYAMDEIAVGFIYQTGERTVAGATGDMDGLVLSAAYTMGANKLKGQFTQSELANIDSDSLAIGVEHKLAKSTMAYAEYATMSTDGVGGAADTDDTVISFGLQHKF